MTQPSLGVPVLLPEPIPPVVTRLVSQAPLPGDNGVIQLIVWELPGDNPLVGHMRIVRMVIDRGGVDVYSLSPDGRNGARHHVPMAMVRLIEEQMPAVLLVEEIEAAEAGDDEGEGEDDADEFEEGAPTSSVQAPANGQSSV